MSALEIPRYKYHRDVGDNGWVEVPLELCQGKPVSCFSYWGYNWYGTLLAFLEEDVDAVAVVGHQRYLENGWHRLRYELEPLYHRGDCFVRTLERFPAAAADGFTFDMVTLVESSRS